MGAARRYTISAMPDRWIVAERDGVRAFVGYIAKAEPDGKGSMHVTVHGPEALLDDLPPPYQPPMIDVARSPDAFAFWWRQLDFVFEFDPPRAFPALSAPLPPSERQIVDRYVVTACELAESEILNAVGIEVSVRVDDHTDAESVIARFERKEVQIGFAGLLRHCDSDRERAYFGHVLEILETAARASVDAETPTRLAQLEEWREAVEKLHQKSLNQLVRDRFVREAAAGILDFSEPQTPKELIRTYDYGDLLHWGRERHTLEAWETDPFVASERRIAFLAAASGLAHAYIGFGELARVATGAAQ